MDSYLFVIIIDCGPLLLAIKPISNVCVVSKSHHNYGIFFYISWLHFRINLVNQLHPMKQCIHLFFWPKQGLQFVGVPNWVVWVFQWVLFHCQNHWTHMPFFYPYFVLISNGALGWTKIPLLISRIPMISIFFVYVHVFGTNIPFFFLFACKNYKKPWTNIIAYLAKSLHHHHHRHHWCHVFPCVFIVTMNLLLCDTRLHLL